MVRTQDGQSKSARVARLKRRANDCNSVAELVAILKAVLDLLEDEL